MSKAATAVKKKPAPRRPRLGPWSIPPSRTIELKPRAASEFTAVPKLERIVKALGVSAAADVLGVDRAQVSRCVKGTEPISLELARRISDVEYVLERAVRVMHTDEIGPWLTQPEPLLGNSIPLNVLTLHGPARVVQALDSIYAGALA
jgi:uncharacterized protein (DUF2384 family)